MNKRILGAALLAAAIAVGWARYLTAKEGSKVQTARSKRGTVLDAEVAKKYNSIH